MRQVCSILLGCSLGLAEAFAAEVIVTQITARTNGVTLTWNTAAGRTYAVESAAAIPGPWQARASLSADAAVQAWTDLEVGVARQRFYRVSATADVDGGLVREGLGAGDFVPNHAMLFGEQSGEIGANAVFLASQVGAGGTQLVTTGTLTQFGQNWTYAPAPNDHLMVAFATGTNLSFFITRMEGDFSVDAGTFLRRNHVFDYRVRLPGVGDLAFTSAIGSGTSNFRATARGTLVRNQVTYDVNLALAGDYRYESDFSGNSRLNDYVVTGTVAAPAYTVAVNQRRRFESIVAVVNFGGATRFDSTTSDQGWNNNTLTLGADAYRWDNVRKQKSFKNDMPASIDSYWQASGGVLKNAQPYGSYRLEANSLMGTVRILMVLPNDVVELETWLAQP